MNAGIQDAENLAWKIAVALDGGAVERLLDAYDVERRHVVVGSISRYTDLVTRLFLQSPPAVRAAAFAALRSAVRVPALHRRALRRSAMLDLVLPPSPLLDRRDRGAGQRLPDALVTTPERTRTRLHDLLPAGAALVAVGVPAADRTPAVAGLPVLHLGPGGYRDHDGVVRELLGDDSGWVLVRPDGCIAWARPGLRAPPATAVEQALGRDTPRHVAEPEARALPSSSRSQGGA